VGEAEKRRGIGLPYHIRYSAEVPIPVKAARKGGTNRGGGNGRNRDGSKEWLLGLLEN